MATSTLTKKLAKAPTWAFSAYAIFAAFTTYFCMYGFRKGFAVGSYDEQTAGFFGSVFALKSALVISQLIGYALSKFIGIKVNSEMPKARRALALISCIVVAELALLAFAVLPPSGKVIAMFFNGLPLGMVWGMVFSFLEGRRLTELLGAGLCCSFIIASGYAKTVGKMLMESGTPEAWMPFTTGLCFLPLFLIAVWMLCQLPDPTPEDESSRVVRAPMDREARRRFVRTFLPGLVAGFIAYTCLTIFRDYRDNFAKEILEETGAISSGYDIDLMSVGTNADLADTGDSLVLAALVGADLHIRIFDRNGRIVIDKPEEDLLSGQRLTDLKELLGKTPLADPSQLPEATRLEFIDKATSISGHTLSSASVFTKTELPIAFGVVSIVALLFLVKDNRRGFFLTHICALTGTLMLGGSTLLFNAGVLGGYGWMVGSGFGAFLAYVPFNCIFYDRMIAAVGTVATAVFCIMLADALGYTGTIGVMIYEQIIGGPEGAKLGFFRNLTYATSIIGSLCILTSWFCFRTKIKS